MLETNHSVNYMKKPLSLGVNQVVTSEHVWKIKQVCMTSDVIKCALLEDGINVNDLYRNDSRGQLEDVQLEAAGIVTSAECRSSHIALYKELGSIQLTEQCKLHQLSKLYSKHYQFAPSYLNEILQSCQREQSYQTKKSTKDQFSWNIPAVARSHSRHHCGTTDGIAVLYTKVSLQTPLWHC